MHENGVFLVSVKYTLVCWVPALAVYLAAQHTFMCVDIISETKFKKLSTGVLKN